MGKVLVGVLLIGGLFAVAVWWWTDGHVERSSLTGIDDDAATNAQEYDDAPVLWVGPEFDVDADGTPEPLSRFRVFDREVAGEGGLPDEVLLGYGQCELGPDTGCTLPLSIRIAFTCRPVSEGRALELLRGGVLLQSLHMQLVTDEVRITVYTRRPLQENAERHYERRVLEALHGANDLATGVTMTSDLTDLVDNCRRS